MHHAGAGSRLPWVLLLVVLALPWLVRLARRSDRGRAGQVLASATLLTAAVLHAAAAAEHAGLQRTAFVLAALVQLVLSGLVLTRAAPWLAVVVAAVSAVSIVIWLETRVVGLHYGIEPVSVLDGTCVAAELVTLLCCGVLRRRRLQPLRLNGEVAGWALIVAAGAVAAAA
jgi:hypothetical protein